MLGLPVGPRRASAKCLLLYFSCAAAADDDDGGVGGGGGDFMMTTADANHVTTSAFKGCSRRAEQAE
jgi:hypothetical protein